MPHEPLTTRNSQLATPQRKAFTLIEMLVVISVIVLAMTLAIPAIRSLTGSRSQEGAQNIITSVLGTTRAEAMALQRLEGIMFFLDTTSDRIQCVAVMETPPQPATDVAGVTYLDLVPDKDPVFLPSGVWLWTIKDLVRPGAIGVVDPFPNSRYLGFNAYFGNTISDGISLNPPVTNIPGGVILFDSTGRLTARRYGFRSATVNSAAPPSALGLLQFNGIATSSTQALQNWPNDNHFLASQIGLCLFDRETFVAQVGTGTTNFKFNNLDATDAATAADVNKWLDSNTTPIFINRYDASLMRAE